MVSSFNGEIVPEFVPKWFLPGEESIEITSDRDRKDPYVESMEANYLRLLHADSLDIRNAWKSLDRYYRKALESPPPTMTGRSVSDFPGIFIAAICGRAAYGPQTPDEFTPMERREIIEKIGALTKSLTKVLQETDLDLPIAYLAKNLDTDPETMFDGFVKEKSRVPEYYFAPSSSVLEQLNMWANYFYNPEKAVLMRPGTKDAAKLFFCRVSTNLFLKFLGMPLYAVTASLAALLLDSDVDAEYVRFASRGISRD